MSFINRSLLLLDKPADFCKEVCGTQSDVNCEGDKTQRDKIKCTCKDGEKIFNDQEKKCEGETITVSKIKFILKLYRISVKIKHASQNFFK